MDIETARWIVVGIATVAFVVWMCGYTYVRHVARETADPSDEPEPIGPTETPPAHWIVGSADLETPSDGLADQAVAALLRGGTDGIGAVKILEKSEDTLRFEPVETDHQQTWFQRGQMQWTSIGKNRSRVDYVLELAPNQKYLWGAWIALALGFVALAVGAPLLYFFVASSPIGGLRYQSIQMVQIVHFLWPPFVFAHVYNRGRRTLHARMDALVHNLPYTKSTN